MKGLWGTDTKCRQSDEQEKGERIVAEAERKVDQLQAVLDERPPRNLDEALLEMTTRRRGG